MTERRYTDEEVAAILERAAEAEHAGRRQLPPSDGLTLADLLARLSQSVAAEPPAVA